MSEPKNALSPPPENNPTKEDIDAMACQLCHCQKCKEREAEIDDMLVDWRIEKRVSEIRSKARKIIYKELYEPPYDPSKDPWWKGDWGLFAVIVSIIGIAVIGSIIAKGIWP